jgi:hypothetical protein
MLVADPHRYTWAVRHRHEDAGCVEALIIRRIGAPSGRALDFRPKPGFSIPDGGTSAAGVVHDDQGRRLNLNEPGVVRAFVDVLTAAQWDAADRTFPRLDGWEWFDAAHRARTAATTARSTSEP